MRSTPYPDHSGKERVRVPWNFASGCPNIDANTRQARRGEVSVRRVLVAVAMGAALVAMFSVGGASAAGLVGSGCIAHHPNYVEDVFEPLYVAGCTGHDEPELDPVSSAPHSAQNLTWRFVLPMFFHVTVSP